MVKKLTWSKKVIIYTDGASRGNPGPASVGIYITDLKQNEVASISETLGEQTNNFAEYTAVVRALRLAIKNKVTEILLRSDSELLIRQLSGEYKVKSETLMNNDIYYKTAKQLILNSKENPISEVLGITKQLRLESPIINKEYKEIIKQVLLTSKDSKTARYLSLERLYKESALLTPTEYTDLKRNILNPSGPSGGPITMKPNKL